MRHYEFSFSFFCAGLTLIGNIIAVAGVISILTGSAVAAKAAVECGIRKRIEHQLREKNLTELIGLSRQLENRTAGNAPGGAGFL